jgi:CRISPR-associated protein Cas1
LATNYKFKIRQSGKQLLVEEKLDDGKIKKKKYAVIQLSGILLHTKARITNEAIELCMSNAIPIIYMDGIEAYAITHPFISHGTVIIRRQQYLSIDDNRGVQIAVGSVLGGLENKRKLLSRYWQNMGSEEKKEFYQIKESIDDIEPIIEKVKRKRQAKTIQDIHSELLGHEGLGSRLYFEAFKSLIPEEWDFTNRIKRPPTDPINAIIGYLSTIITGQLVIRCLVAGLDPYQGYLHSDRAGRPSLALDLIEQFRQPFIDRIILNLVRRKELQRERDFESGDFGIQLTNSGKGILLSKFFGNLDKKVTWRGTNQPKKVILVDQVQHAIHVMLRKKKNYSPYIEDVRNK